MHNIFMNFMNMKPFVSVSVSFASHICIIWLNSSSFAIMKTCSIFVFVLIFPSKMCMCMFFFFWFKILFIYKIWRKFLPLLLNNAYTFTHDIVFGNVGQKIIAQFLGNKFSAKTGKSEKWNLAVCTNKQKVISATV